MKRFVKIILWTKQVIRYFCFNICVSCSIWFGFDLFLYEQNVKHHFLFFMIHCAKISVVGQLQYTLVRPRTHHTHILAFRAISTSIVFRDRIYSITLARNSCWNGCVKSTVDLNNRRLTYQPKMPTNPHTHTHIQRSRSGVHSCWGIFNDVSLAPQLNTFCVRN